MSNALGINTLPDISFIGDLHTQCILRVGAAFGSEKSTDVFFVA
jgi:hypothetical protein